MKLTIAGANSFIGQRLISIASDSNKYEITAIIRENSSSREIFKSLNNIHIVECNMQDYEKLGTLVDRGDCFINLAWNGSRGETRGNRELQQSNYQSSILAAKSMIDNGYKIIVSAGSQAEYGLCNGVISENTECKPNTEYGIAKLQIFDTLKNLCKSNNVRFIEPRYFSLYGPGDYKKTLIMSCLKKMIKNEIIELNPCNQIWDYLYVDDAVDALLRLIESDDANGAFNFASGNHQELKKFILEMKVASESDSKIFFSESDAYAGMLINLRPCIQKLIDTTNGWGPKTSFQEGIKKIISTEQI